MRRKHDWPGSRWWRVDLHAHSPESRDFRPESEGEKDWEGWITAAAEANLDAVAITDHNTAGAISEIKSAASKVSGCPVFFPGAEITASDGVHLLVLMDPSRGEEHMEDLLSRVEIAVDKRGTDLARSKLNVEQILERIGGDALVLGPHVNGPKGLLTVHDGHERLAVLRDPRLSAVEVDPEREVDQSWLDGSKPEVGRRISQVWSSDAHSFEELGRRFTWVKMTRPDIEGLGLALLDGTDSLQPVKDSDADDPNSQHGALLIERIVVTNARFMGRREPMNVRFNPWLNAIIGGRGTGKSTLIDFCRKTLRRDGELNVGGTTDEGSLRRVFDRRLLVPPTGRHEGLLTEETCIELIYRKHEERFALTWSPSGGMPSIFRLGADGRKPEEGSVSERFPVRIYSQKQLFAMAQDPDALLTIIDDSTHVQAAERNREIEHLKSRYLSLRAQARTATARAEGLSARRAALSDIQHKLDFLQQGDQARQLSEYRKRRQLDDAWEAVVTATRESVQAVADSARQLSVADLDLGDPGSDGDPREHLDEAHAALGRVTAGLRRLVFDGVEVTENLIEEMLTGEHIRRWREALKASEDGFREASAQLADQGISSPGEYQDLVADAARLQREIAGLERDQSQAEQLNAEAARTLERYREQCDELGGARSAFATEATGDVIRVEVLPLTNTGGLRSELTGILGTDRFDADRRALAERIRQGPGESWSWERLDQILWTIRRFQSGELDSWPTKDWRFQEALRRVPAENIDRLALYCPNDSVRVSFRDPQRGWRPMTQASPGQQTAALLAFVLGHGEEPIILDQPEDDLDNTLIYDLLVRQLRETKPKRQVIVVTHNPNIVVHGDAEFVLSLDAGNGESRKACEGGLQEQKVRDEICTVMEGGREAFKSRYRRIMPLAGGAP